MSEAWKPVGREDISAMRAAAEAEIEQQLRRAGVAEEFGENAVQAALEKVLAIWDVKTEKCFAAHEARMRGDPPALLH